MINSLIFYLVLLVYIAFILVRIFRWLAVIQQKEYRLDRFLTFFKSKEGKKDFFRLFPLKELMNMRSIKRPVRTLRVMMFFSLNLFFLIFPFIIFNRHLYILIFLTLYYLLIPFVFLCLSLLTDIVKKIIEFFLLSKARAIIQKGKPIIVGITGSYGKTISKELISQVLSKKYSVFKTPQSFNTPISVALSIIKSYKGQKIAVIEYAAYKRGEIKRIAKFIKPDVAVITGISDQHLALFGNIQNLIKAKSELVLALPKGSTVFCGSEDSKTMKVCNSRSDIKIIKCNDLIKENKIENITLNKNYYLEFKYKKELVTTKLFGKHYIDAIKNSITLGNYFKIDHRKILVALKNYSSKENMTISINTNSKGSLLINDRRSSNSKGFKSAIELADEINSKKKNEFEETVLITQGIVDLGEESKSIHKEIALKAREVFSKVYYLGFDGDEEFKNIFNEDFVNDVNQIKNRLANSGKSLYLLEGKLHKWVYDLLL
ncbi:MAG: Mur ligase family protein [Patescibacteria group bacterium]